MWTLPSCPGAMTLSKSATEHPQLGFTLRIWSSALAGVLDHEGMLDVLHLENLADLNRLLLDDDLGGFSGGLALGRRDAVQAGREKEHEPRRDNLPLNLHALPSSPCYVSKGRQTSIQL